MDRTARKRKRIACLLAIALIFGSMPAAAFAAEPDYRFEEVEYYSKVTESFIPAGCYYTDEWFSGDASARNDALALASAQLAAAGCDGEHGTAFLKALGFENVVSRRFGSTENDCAYTIGTKTVSGKTLAAAVFQGDLYGDKGWQQNVTINDGGASPDQASYRAAAEAFAADYAGMNLTGDVTVWLTGQSRGGAIANLAAAYLLDSADAPAVFCYTFEAPATTNGSNDAAHDAKYAGIHNYICDDDPVAMLPIWGMTRYGQEHIYNTAALEDVQEEIIRLNPGTAEFAQGYDAAPFGGDVKAFLEGLMGKLAQVVPSREAYTQPHDAGFSYTYQQGLQALCHVIFGYDGELMGKFSPLLDYLSDLTYSYLEETYAQKAGGSGAEALLEDAAALRLGVAQEYCGLLNDGAAAQTVSAEDVYALLTFLSPLLINDEALDEDWELPPYDEEWTWDYFSYVNMDLLMRIASGSSTLVFSHHPDTILARLSLLAPAPMMDSSIALAITEPSAGHDTALAPSELEDGLQALGLPWLVCKDAQWLTGDSALQDGKLYYLQLTISPVAHSVPEDLSLTVNGQAPESLDVSYPGGPAVITAVWPYQFGEEEPVTVSFDMNGHGTAPESYTVPAGSILERASRTPPAMETVKDETGYWVFDGWSGEDGTPWEEITADGDVTLYAGWAQWIDEIELTYEIPRVGDSGDALARFTVPEGALYALMDGDYMVVNESWDTVETIGSMEELQIIFTVYSPGGIPFTEMSGENEGRFAGTFTVNGEVLEDVDVTHEFNDGEENISIRVSYCFYPLPAETKPHTPSAPAPSEPDPEEPEPAGFVDVPEGAYYEKAVDWAVENGITAGTDETHFSPDAVCTRAQVITMLWAASGAPSGELPGRFEDVAESDYYAKAVAWAVENGVTAGTDGTHFSPDAPCTRAQVITMLWAAAGAPSAEPSSRFEDVAEDAYYARAVAWALEKDVTAGTDETHFSPDAVCTRAQAVTFLYLAMGGE